MAPATIGAFLRAFTFGHVRQLDRLTELLLTRAWAAGASPGDGPMTIDLDSTVCEVHGYHKQGAAYGYTHTLGYHPLLASRADTGEVLHTRQRTGRANTARGAARFVDEVVARARRAGATGELTMRMNQDHRRHATVELCIRDLKAGVGLRLCQRRLAGGDHPGAQPAALGRRHRPGRPR